MIAKVRRRLPSKGKRKQERRIGELKFGTTSAKTRRQILMSLARQDIALFVLVLDKEGREIRDTPENYAALVLPILAECAAQFANLDAILLDRHFSRRGDQDVMSRLLRAGLKQAIQIRHMDSLQDSRIDLADFVAGAVAFARTRGDTAYEDLIRDKIKAYKVVRWSEKEKW